MRMSRVELLNRFKASISVIEEYNDASNQLIFITAAGVIMGKPLNLEDKTTNIMALSLKAKLPINDDKKLELDDIEVVNLKDVQIITASNVTPIKIPFLSLFLDDVQGLSIGSLS